MAISCCDICGRSSWRLTVVVIDVYEFVQEVFDRRHAAQDDGMQRGHPLLLPMTQLKAQIPHALKSLRETERDAHGAAGVSGWVKTGQHVINPFTLLMCRQLNCWNTCLKIQVLRSWLCSDCNPHSVEFIVQPQWQHSVSSSCIFLKCMWSFAPTFPLFEFKLF